VSAEMQKNSQLSEAETMFPVRNSRLLPFRHPHQVALFLGLKQAAAECQNPSDGIEEIAERAPEFVCSRTVFSSSVAFLRTSRTNVGTPCEIVRSFHGVA